MRRHGGRPLPTTAGALVDLALTLSLVVAGFDPARGHVVGLTAGSVLAVAIWRSRPAAFAIVQTLALLLRGTLLAALAYTAGWPTAAAAAVAVAVSWSVTWVGAGLWIVPPKTADGPARERLDRRRIVAMVAYALALRFVFGGALGLLHEEGYYWNYSQHLALGYLDHPPMVGWLGWIATWLGGRREFALRSITLACWLVAAAYAWRLAWQVGGRRTALNALLMLTLLPAFFVAGLFLMTEAPLLACWSAALYYLHRALIGERRAAWLGFGAFMGLGLLSKYTMLLLGGGAALYVLFDRDARRWLARPQPYLAVVLSVALFAPVLVWNATHDWASFRFQSVDRVADKYHFALQDLVGSALLLLTPPGLAAVAVAFRRGRVLAKGPREPDAARSHRLLVTLTAVPLLVFFVVSLFRIVQFNWTLPLWLGLIPYVALLANSTRPGSAAGPRPFVERWLLPTSVALLFLWGGAAYHLTLGIPGVPLPQNVLGVGKDDLARQVDEAVRSLQERTGERPVVVCLDEDQIASWLAFYRGRGASPGDRDSWRWAVDETTGGHLFDNDSHMYARWFPSEQLLDRPVVLVSPKPHWIEEPPMIGSVRFLGPMQEVHYSQRGRPAGMLYLRPAQLVSEP
jgi:dolichol-phosphate mannosyltransferase